MRVKNGRKCLDHPSKIKSALNSDESILQAAFFPANTSLDECLLNID